VSILYSRADIGILSDYIDSFDTQDGLYDVAWSEIHENQAVIASGDGSLKLFDITLNVGSLFSSRSNKMKDCELW
jgi:hypothetical protein